MRFKSFSTYGVPQGYGGSDLLAFDVDVKTSRMKYSSERFYNLWIRPQEYHPKTCYYLALMYPNKDDEVIFVGRAYGHEVPFIGDKHGVTARQTAQYVDTPAYQSPFFINTRQYSNTNGNEIMTFTISSPAFATHTGTLEPAAPPAPRYVGWRVLHRSEGGRQTPDGMPCVVPSINVPGIYFERGMQLAAYDLLCTNSGVTADTWKRKYRVVYGTGTAFTNYQGYGETPDRADFVNNVNVARTLHLQ